MQKKAIATQIYGYAICLVAIVTFIICLAALVSAIFDLTSPLKARSSYSRSNTPSMVSFENYKMDLMRDLPEGQQLPDDETLRKMYEAAKTELIDSLKYQAYRNIISLAHFAREQHVEQI